MAGAGPCSWAARTTSADGGSTRPWPPRAGHCPIASARWRSPTSSAERDEVRSTCRRCRTAPPGSWRPWLSWPANCVPRGPPASVGTAPPAAAVTGGCARAASDSRAEAAHLVCVNHALLLTGPETLPPFEDVVIDEAHMLYHEATEAFSEEIDAVSYTH